MVTGGTETGRITPVILVGGDGQRLWPVSTPGVPKPFVQAVGDRSMLQVTALRLGELPNGAAPVVACGRDHVGLVREQLQEVGVLDFRVVTEPFGWGTAAAVASVALMSDSDDMLLIAPVDHFVADTNVFSKTVVSAASAAGDRKLVLVGVEPDRPETGFGWLEPGCAEGEAYEVRSFCQKPGPLEAWEMLRSGRWWWNTGIWVGSAGLFLDELDRHGDNIVGRVERTVNAYMGLPQPSEWCGGSLESVIAERSTRCVVVPLRVGWEDLGVWGNVYGTEPKDGAGNVVRGPVRAENVENSYLRSDGPQVLVLGLVGVAVVVSEGGVLVTKLGDSQGVRFPTPDVEAG